MPELAIDTIVYAILLILALVIIGLVIVKGVAGFKDFVVDSIGGIKNFIKSLLPWYSKWLV